MDIIRHRDLHNRLLDIVAREALGQSTCGVSTGGGSSRIHLLDGNPPEQQRASDVLKNFGSLAATATVTALTEGEADPQIGCRDALIADDDRLGYVILRDGVSSMRGKGELQNGVFSLTLRQLKAGDYTVFFYRLRGNFASGALQIRVDPAQE